MEGKGPSKPHPGPNPHLGVLKVGNSILFPFVALCCPRSVIPSVSHRGVEWENFGSALGGAHEGAPGNL